MSKESWTHNDYLFMGEAIQLAKKGLYTTSPNPRVGCVLVCDKQIVGKGWHKKAGEGHAEVNAIAEAGSSAKGSTAYVTLEPCSHFGRTPPCASALIGAGVAEVIVAMTDPNPKVSGSGCKLLKAAGLKVRTGLLDAQARELNPGFVQRMEKRRPWVRIKMAISVDGRTAMASGESQWITGAAARSDVQELRARSCAILTGIGTILSDDAALTVRAEQLDIEVNGVTVQDIVERQPLRVVLDSDAKMPISSRMLGPTSPVLWVVSDAAVLDQGIIDLEYVEVLRVPELNSKTGMTIVLNKLCDMGCNEILIEAGATLAGSFIDSNLWDELVVYMAPKLLGSQARALANLPLSKMSDAKDMILKDLRIIGDDVRMTYLPSRQLPLSASGVTHDASRS